MIASRIYWDLLSIFRIIYQLKTNLGRVYTRTHHSTLVVYTDHTQCTCTCSLILMCTLEACTSLYCHHRGSYHFSADTSRSQGKWRAFISYDALLAKQIINIEFLAEYLLHFPSVFCYFLKSWCFGFKFRVSYFLTVFCG